MCRDCGDGWPASIVNLSKLLVVVHLTCQGGKENPMNDLTIQLALAHAYHNRAYTNDYIFCFTWAGMFYAVKMENADVATLNAISTVSRTSSKRGGYAALRFRPTNAVKRAIVEMGNVVYKSTKANFDALCKSSKYNKGEVAEMLVTEKVFGEKWVKDSVPFTDGADVSHYQVKFQGATFCTERQV